MTDSPAGDGRVALRPLARAARKLGRADGGGAVREPSLEEAEPMKPVPGGTPGWAWLSEYRRFPRVGGDPGETLQEQRRGRGLELTGFYS